jgi:dTDP-4-amino-4,6-dideoxygalactose transaminase
VRRQLPVSSPVTLRGLLRGARAALGADASRLLVAELRERYDVAGVALCDSGTSALVVALRAALPPNGIAAFPSYSCVDLAAAARFAGVRVRLYDLDPTTLSADLESLERTLRRGVDAVVAVHLYGYPADVPAMRTLARAHGATLIEDAAQAAGSRLCGRLVGGLGDLSILSFGRGKGTTGGRGGAIMAADPAWSARLEPHLGGVGFASGSGWGDLTRTAAQWVLGRPMLYGLPSAIPGLRLGEMVYHPAREPMPISRAAVALVRSAMRLDQEEVACRRRHAAVLSNAVRASLDVTPVQPIARAEPGFLRYAVLAAGPREPAPSLGIARGYPRALYEQPELRPQLLRDEPEPLGGRRLRESLFTLPVHSHLTTRDVARLRHWLETAATR